MNQSLILLSACILFSCNKHTSKPSSQTTQMNKEVHEIATKNFGEDYTLTYNDNKEYVLISKTYTTRKTDPDKTLRIEVLKVKPLESIFTDAIYGGKADWKESYVLMVTGKKGIPNPNNPDKDAPSYNYDVINKKKFKGGFFNAKN